MRFAIVAMATFGVLAAGNAAANEKLAQSNGCMTCHAVDKKVIGPSYKEIAAKYRSDKAAEANLVKKVKAGGSGVWGADMMPPQPHVSSADAERMAKLIMALK